MKDWVAKYIPGLIGAVIGGVVGVALYSWGLGQGLKAGVVPGAFVGLGSGLLSDRMSRGRGAICGVLALLLGLYVEWRYFWNAETPAEFLGHVHKLLPLNLIMIGLGAFLGYRWGGDSFKPRLLGRGVAKPEPSRELPEGPRD